MELVGDRSEAPYEKFITDVSMIGIVQNYRNWLERNIWWNRIAWSYQNGQKCV